MGDVRSFRSTPRTDSAMATSELLVVTEDCSGATVVGGGNVGGGGGGTSGYTRALLGPVGVNTGAGEYAGEYTYSRRWLFTQPANSTAAKRTP